MRPAPAHLMTLVLVPLLLGAAPGPPPKAPAEATPEEEFHRGVEYRGAAGFFWLRNVTVVYPAGAGERADVNKRSAETRARWLASVYRSTVAVAADDQLTEDQKQGNLLLLGWDNKYFASPGPARPFVHDSQGLSFLGIRESDPSVDLLVFHRNPLHWDSYILFWSRIDPERDRFQVVPRVGSDWAIYRDYGALRQGMFVPARTWPPNRDTAAEANHKEETPVRPGGTGTFTSEHYFVVYDAVQFSAADAKAIAQAREGALAKAAAAVGPIPAALRINLFVYDTAEDKQIATGVPDPTHSIGSREMHAIRAYALSPAAREEVNILARERYGPGYLTAIRDGLALSVENSLRGQDLESQAGRLRAVNRFPALADLLDEERFRALPDEIASPAAGAFMIWVRQTYGPDGVKKIYGLSEGTTAAFAKALATTPQAVNSAWEAWGAAKVAALKNQIDFETASLEAQRLHTANDWVGMTAALRKALLAKPGDPQTLFNLASAQMRSGDLAGAEASIKDVLAAPLAPADSRFRIFGHYQLGRVYDLAGRRTEALVEYDAVLALPDEHGAHAAARERKASPATREQLE